MPVEVEDRLARSRACIHHDTVVLQALARSNVGDEVQHPLVLIGREPGDFVEARDVPLRDHEQVRLRLRIDVPDGDEAIGRGHVLPVADQAAEQAVYRHAATTPSSQTEAPRPGTKAPPGAAGST